MQKVLIWIVSFIITLSTAYYQRITGPTYPINDKITFNNTEIKYTLARSHGGFENHEVILETENKNLDINLYWKALNSPEDWHKVKFEYKEGKYIGILPNPKVLAAKLEYYVEISNQSETIKLPQDKDFIIIRFKGDVPLWALIPHVIVMFGTMLLATRTGIEALLKRKNVNKLTYWTIGFLLIGGFILGPLVQKFAFDAYWTGFPFGYDLTDNKTLLALIGWLIALFMIKKNYKPNLGVILASIIMLVIFLIPHSLLGSEADYQEINKQQTERSIEN